MLKTMLFTKKHNQISEGCCFVYKHTVNNRHFNFYAHMCLCFYFHVFVMFVWIGICQQFLPWAINSACILFELKYRLLVFQRRGFLHCSTVLDYLPKILHRWIFLPSFRFSWGVFPVFKKYFNYRRMFLKNT